ncbi:MAG: hypothetical protein WA717_01225 [Methyloceanibacter sp.]
MAQLVVLICLLATPEKCSEMAVPDAIADDVVSCLKSAGDKADAWQKVNNQYFVIGWRCEKKGASPTTK